jgi:quercetin dioxygenase-like cupin family protein
MRSTALFFASLWLLQANAQADEMGVARKLADNKFEANPALPDCASAAPANGDPSKEAFVLLVKLKGNCKVPWHWHTANEELFIISGNATMEMKDMKPTKLGAGGYSRMAGKHPHQLTCAGGCMLFVSSDGAFDIHYIDTDGKEISKEEALAKKPVQARRPPK